MAWRCACGGLLDLVREPAFPASLDGRVWSLWRYLEALPFADGDDVWKSVTLGEGMSPLVPERADDGVLLKLDFVMPTLSFKDRGAAVLMARAARLGVDRVVADSSGNAGTSIAAYAARAGIRADILVPAATSPKKIRQIEEHGATVHRVPGSREDTAAAAVDAVERGGSFYASHVYNPVFYEGTKTFAFEVWEQLGRRVPGTVVIPVGNGTLVLGAYYGFTLLHELGLADGVPRILAVQSERCAPLAAAFAEGGAAPATVATSETLAEGIAIAAPARGRQVLDAVRATGGTFVTAAEDAVLPARSALAARGVYVEPTTAATYAAWTASGDGSHADHGAIGDAAGGVTVLALCGAGLKFG